MDYDPVDMDNPLDCQNPFSCFLRAGSVSWTAIAARGCRYIPYPSYRIRRQNRL